MQVLENKDTADLLATLLQEAAKATNELRCAERDVAKAASRQGFIIVLLNELISRQENSR